MSFRIRSRFSPARAALAAAIVPAFAPRLAAAPPSRLVPEARAAACAALLPKGEAMDRLRARPLLWYDRDSTPVAWTTYVLANPIDRVRRPDELLDPRRVQPIVVDSEPPTSYRAPSHANAEYPWLVTAGLEHAPAARTVTFLALPPGAKVRAFRVDRVHRGVFDGAGAARPFLHSPPSIEPTIRWEFPDGATAGEILTLPAASGGFVAFEVRARVKEAGKWSSRVFRPFPTPEALVAAIDRLWPAAPPADVAALRAHCASPPAPRVESLGDHLGRDRYEDPIAAPEARRMVATGQLRGGLPAEMGPKPARNVLAHRLFATRAAVDTLPAIRPEHAERLLRETPFADAAGSEWCRSADGVPGFAPTTAADLQIVPRGYLGAFYELSSSACNRCHETAGRPAVETSTTIHRYGNVRGADGVISWHPFDRASIGRDTVKVDVRLDPRLAGLVEWGPARREE